MIVELLIAARVSSMVIAWTGLIASVAAGAISAMPFRLEPSALYRKFVYGLSTGMFGFDSAPTGSGRMVD